MGLFVIGIEFQWFCQIERIVLWIEISMFFNFGLEMVSKLIRWSCNLVYVFIEVLILANTLFCFFNCHIDARKNGMFIYFHYIIQRCFGILKITPFMNPLVNEPVFEIKIHQKNILQLFC